MNSFTESVGNHEILESLEYETSYTPNSFTESVGNHDILELLEYETFDTSNSCIPFQTNDFDTNRIPGINTPNGMDICLLFFLPFFYYLHLFILFKLKE